MSNVGPRSFFDTDVLSRAWAQPQPPRTVEESKGRAKQLMDLYRTRFVSSPSRIEFLCGVGNGMELKLKEAFIDEFSMIDAGNIPVADWSEAARFAKRFGDRIRLRKLGDCLMKALSLRLRCDVITCDRDFTERARRPDED